MDREGNCHRQGTRWLVRTGWQNGIPYPPGRALAGCVLFSLCSALASPSFRLAGQSRTLTLVRWVSEMRVVSGKGGVAKRNGAFAVRFRLRLWLRSCSLVTALAGCMVDRLSLPLRVVRVAMLTALAGNPCTIPFCRKRMALGREGNCHRQGARWLVRTGWQNGIPYPPGRALAGCVPFSLCSALAGLWCSVTSCSCESEVPFGGARSC